MSELEFLNNCYEYEVMSKEKYIKALRKLKGKLSPDDPYFPIESRTCDEINRILSELI